MNTQTRHWTEAALELANIEYYQSMLEEQMKATKVPDEGTLNMPVLKIGDYAECGECHEERRIWYMYGGVKPLCITCGKEILD